MIDFTLGSDDQDQKGRRDRGELTLGYSVYGLSDFLTKTSGEPPGSPLAHLSLILTSHTYTMPLFRTECLLLAILEQNQW